MSAVPRWIKPLKQIVDAIFRHDLALRRDAEGVRVVLSDRADKDRLTPAEETAAKEKQELNLMCSQLVALLDELPETRNAMRHLAFVEQALGRKGLRALDKLPLDLMRQALEQFEGLVTNWSPVGLASLRSKMAVAIIRRESMDPNEVQDSFHTSVRHETAPPRDAAGVVVLEREDEEALQAAYAAYAAMKSPHRPPAEVVMHGLPDSPGGDAAQAAAGTRTTQQEVKLRQLQT
jgi:hypothetical protein